MVGGGGSQGRRRDGITPAGFPAHGRRGGEEPQLGRNGACAACASNTSASQVVTGRSGAVACSVLSNARSTTVQSHSQVDVLIWEGAGTHKPVTRRGMFAVQVTAPVQVHMLVPDRDELRLRHPPH